MGFGQYLQDTRAELRHVAWPTRMQTIVYTVMVILISIFIAAYLGLFDYVFTSTLARVVNANASAPTTVEQPVASSSPSQTPIDINSILPSGTDDK